MRKIIGLSCLLAMGFCVTASSASAQWKPLVVIQGTSNSGPVPPGGLSMTGEDTGSDAQNGMSGSLTQQMQPLGAAIGGTPANPGFKNGTMHTVPYFQSWFATNTHGSIYTYSMIGQNPRAGGVTGINSEVIPVVVALFNGHNNLEYIFDPTVSHDPQGSDLSLVLQSPMFDPTVTYPGNGSTLPADTGPFVDTVMRASFVNVRTPNWHTIMNTPTLPAVQYVLSMQYTSGDWACIKGEPPPCTSIPVVNIATLFNDFKTILQYENPSNSIIPIVITDYVVAYDPGNMNCCEVGNHTALTGISDPTGPLVYVWATFLPQSNDPWAPGFIDTSILSHELTEAFNNPFISNSVAPWIDGSVQFLQANMETGDVIERMNPADSIFAVPRTPNGVPYTYHVQNEALLGWFTRTPMAPAVGPGPGVYSWPNTNTLNNGHNPSGPCGALLGCWVYGEAPGGFAIGPPY